MEEDRGWPQLAVSFGQNRDASLVAPPDGYESPGPGGEVEPEGDAVGSLHHQRSRITGTDRAVDVACIDQ